MNSKNIPSALAIVALALLAGCGGPKGPSPSDRPITDASEGDLVGKMSAARDAYRSSLGILRDYYIRHGSFDKQMLAEKELKELEGVTPNRYLVLTDRPDAAASSVNLADANEVDLVEKMAKSRMDYRTSLEALRDCYIRHGSYDKQMLAEKELKELKGVTPNRYLVLTDLPPVGATKPTSSIAQANELFDEGVKLYKNGRIWGVPLAYSKKDMRAALDKFDRLIKEYPQSDKVALAFFNAAEILKEYLYVDQNQGVQAAEYYRRAYEADPNIPEAAHFQRAAVLDYRLHMRDEAMKEYNLAITIEGKRPGFKYSSNSDWAAGRIRQLLGQ